MMLQYIVGWSFGAIILALVCFRHRAPKTTQNTSAETCSQRKQIAAYDGAIDTQRAFPSLPHLFNSIQVRQIYHSLHQLETNPEVLPVAKEILLSSLETAESYGKAMATSNSIYAISEYTPDKLRNWVDESDATIMKEFEEYSLRRADGGPRELLQERSDATRWLRAQAPLRYVDGAWLGHLSRVDVPWEHVAVVRKLWQTLSEELGDGDVNKHHTRLYAQLLKSLSPDSPNADSHEFLTDRHGANDDLIWRSAVLQLIISLFHRDFLPEILGFNLHFERITLGMLQAMTELKELGLDATYFMLHVCIDNAATGHTAVALNAVLAYLYTIKKRDGCSAEQQAWNRIQAGYTLSEGSWMACPSDPFKRTQELQQSVMDMFESKAKAGSGAHHMCKGKIKGRRVVDWLDLSQIGNAAWWQSLTQSLSTSRAWISPGDSDKSHFFKEISWGGRMFGAFTESEASTLRQWIDRLPRDSPPSRVQRLKPDNSEQSHRNMNNSPAPYVSLSVTAPALERCRAIVLAAQPGSMPNDLLFGLDPNVLLRSEALPAVWFSHFCLLEKFITLPPKCGTPLGGLILRVLRAQDGFFLERDQMADKNASIPTEIGLIHDLGRQLLQYQGLSNTTSLSELLCDQRYGELPEVMLCISKAPVACQGMLLGMAAGFISLHNAIATSPVLSPQSRSQMHRVAIIEQAELQSALLMLDCNGRTEFAGGFAFVKQQLEMLFSDQS